MARLPDNISPRPRFAVLPPERRNLAPRKTLVHRIEAEFHEMPGLCLTTAQASRLFHVEPDVCARVFSELIEHDVLVLRTDGRYRLRPTAA